MDEIYSTSFNHVPLAHAGETHTPEYFQKHCEIVSMLVSRGDKHHTAVKHHIRAAIREASNHICFSAGSPKHSAQYMSLAAKKALKIDSKVKLIMEHVVPVSILNEKIFALESPTSQAIEQVLLNTVIRAVITPEEDASLKNLKLSKSLPDINNLFSRYEKAEISLVKNDYKNLSKPKIDKLSE
jgi:hypothetical protein